MNKKFIIYGIILFLSFGSFLFCQNQQRMENGKMKGEGSRIKLPAPRLHSEFSLEQAIANRRSVREFKPLPVSIEVVSQLLWAAQGITDTVHNFRTAPSAGALFPLEIYVVVSNVTGLPKGVYKYLPQKNEIQRIKEGDVVSELMREALYQDWIEQSALILVYAAVFERTTWKYGKRGIQYVYMEVGHSAQNVCLQATALGLGTTTVGAFNDEGIKRVVGLAKDEHPLYILPIGVK
ncbi:MAG: SagB/ThcOx family dehydrogenase [Ignavibacteria bacterium]|nr:SagB/ThcOx family dehydrogenase [Ignavibacteria bacterium]